MEPIIVDAAPLEIWGQIMMVLPNVMSYEEEEMKSSLTISLNEIVMKWSLILLW